MQLGPVQLANLNLVNTAPRTPAPTPPTTVADTPTPVDQSNVKATAASPQTVEAAGATAAKAATAAALIAPGTVLTVEQVAQHLTELGVEFRRTGLFSSCTPAQAAKALQKKKPLEYRVDEGKWVRVQNPQQLAQLLAQSDLVQGQAPSPQSKGLSASAHNAAAEAAGAGIGGLAGAALKTSAKYSAPFKLLVEPERVGTVEFATGILSNIKNPVMFFEQFHKEHGKSFMVELPTGQRFLFDHRAESVMAALKVTDSPNPNQVQSWFKPELQGHGLSFLMGMDNVFLGRGEEWKKTHEVMKPHLHGTTINTDGVTQQVGQIVERHIQGIKDQVKAQGGAAEVDFRITMQRATLDVALQLLLGARLSDEELGKTQESFQKTMKWLTLETANPTDFSLSRLPGNKGLREAYDHLQGLADRIIREHRENPDQQDVVSSLLQATDPHTGKPFSDERIRNEIITLLLAGHETTATLLSWSFAELSRKPELWKELQGEVDQKLKGKFPSYKDLKGLESVDHTVDETLRLYSPAYFLVREAAMDTTLGPPEAMVHAPKGTQLIMSTYHMQRDKDDWGERAEEFDPHRFDSDRRDERGKMHPFGSGARVCMGQHLAKLEANLILTRFAQEFEMEAKPEAPLEIESDISVHPSDAKVNLKLRSSGPTPEGPPEVKTTAGRCPFLANLKAAQPQE